MSPSLLFDLIVAAYWKNAFSISDLHLYSEKKGRNSSFSLRYSFYLGSKMFTVYSEVRCAAASKSCAIVFGYRAQPSCSAFLPGALGDSQGPVKPVCVCERSLGPDSAPNRPAIGGGGVFSPPPHWPSPAPVPGCRLLLQVC